MGLEWRESDGVNTATALWSSLKMRDYVAKYKMPRSTTFEKERKNHSNRNIGGISFNIKASLTSVLLSETLITNVDVIFTLLQIIYRTKLAITLVSTQSKLTYFLDQTGKVIYKDTRK